MTYRERLHQELWRPVLENWRWIVYPCLLIGIGFSVFELLHFRTSFGDIPIVLIAGAVIGLQFMSLFALIFAMATTWITHTTVVELLEHSWAARVRRKRPDTSFSIPYWPFRIIAAIPAGGVFLLVMAVWTLVVYALPMQFDPLADAISRLYPEDN